MSELRRRPSARNGNGPVEANNNQVNQSACDRFVEIVEAIFPWIRCLCFWVPIIALLSVLWYNWPSTELPDPDQSMQTDSAESIVDEEADRSGQEDNPAPPIVDEEVHSSTDSGDREKDARRIADTGSSGKADNEPKTELPDPDQSMQTDSAESIVDEEAQSGKANSRDPPPDSRRIGVEETIPRKNNADEGTGSSSQGHDSAQQKVEYGDPAKPSSDKETTLRVHRDDRDGEHSGSKSPDAGIGQVAKPDISLPCVMQCVDDDGAVIDDKFVKFKDDGTVTVEFDNSNHRVELRDPVAVNYAVTILGLSEESNIECFELEYDGEITKTFKRPEYLFVKNDKFIISPRGGWIRHYNYEFDKKRGRIWQEFDINKREIKKLTIVSKKGEFKVSKEKIEESIEITH